MQEKVLIIDDEKEILLLLETVLKKEGFINVKIVDDSIEGIEVCKNYKPNIVILDIMMPKMDGLQVLKEIRKFSDVPILFLSAKSEDIDKILGLGLGADDYITKPFSPKEVAFRIKAHLRRIERIREGILFKNNVFKTEDFTIDFNKGIIIRDNEIYALKAKELKLLQLLVVNKNNIIDKQSILENVWGDNFEGYDNTLMVHIRKLREKLESNPSKPKYIKTVKGIGYKICI